LKVQRVSTNVVSVLEWQ